MKKFTNQQAFDKVYRHFIINRKPFSVGKSGNSTRLVCVYRGSKGERCGAGIFVPKRDYDQGLVTEGVTCVSSVHREYFSTKVRDLIFLRALQGAHDTSAFDGNTLIKNKVKFKGSLIRIAIQYNLTIPKK